MAAPLGPLSRLTSMMVSGGGCRLRTTNRTTGPASFSASTARLCTTSETSTSFTRRTQSFTLLGKPKRHDSAPPPLQPPPAPLSSLSVLSPSCSHAE